MSTMKCSGSAMFRQRIVASILSNKALKIDKIRSENDTTPGLQDFEANFLRLVEKVTDGCRIEINETGTILRFRPGILIGGKITHDCGLSRSIGWFVEALIPLAPFCKAPLQLTLTGITNDDLDFSVDTLANVTFPLLQNFGIYNASFKIKHRGAPPRGGGMVELMIPTVRSSLKTVFLVDEGLVKRVRGVAYCTHISPTIITRVIDSCREVLNGYLPDVYIHTDHYKGKKEGGASPGYALSLVAETTTGVLISTERTAKCRKNATIPGTEDISSKTEVPEDIGRDAALSLLQEVYSGGVVDSAHQPLILQLMVLTPEDISSVRFGELSPQAIETLRLLREAFGVTFKITEDKAFIEANEADGASDSDDEENDEDNEDVEEGGDSEGEDVSEDEGEMDVDEDASDNDNASEGSDDHSNDSVSIISGEEQGGPARKQLRSTYVLTCLGTGYVNANRKAT